MGYIVKPFTDEDLHTSIEIAIYKFAQRFRVPNLTLKLLNDKLKSPLSNKEFEI